jgi:uncharacterized protein (UPF0297 family)
MDYTKINIKTLLKHHLKNISFGYMFIDISCVVMVIIAYYFKLNITIYPFIFLTLLTMLRIYFTHIESLVYKWKNWNKNYYDNFQIKKEKKQIYRTHSSRGYKHVYDIIEYYKNGDVKSHKRFTNGDSTIGPLDPSYKQGASI